MKGPRVRVVVEGDPAPEEELDRLGRALSQRLVPGIGRVRAEVAWKRVQAGWEIRRITAGPDGQLDLTYSMGAGVRAAGIPVAAIATRRGIDARRSPRIPHRVHLRLEAEKASYEATTAVINGHGALVLSAGHLDEEARVKVTNLESGLSEPFRVVWCEPPAGAPKGGPYRIGMEALTPGVDFWGPAYRPAAGQ